MLDLNLVESFIIWCFLVYVIGCSGAYLLLNLTAYFSLKSYLAERRAREDESLYTGNEPPITVIMPAYNEGTTIITSVRSALMLNYPNLEVVVVNDGSKDNTLEVLKSTFDFEAFPEVVRERIPTQKVRGIYLSRSVNNLRLVDKENGGKADAINAGINVSRCPLFCCIDADSVLEPHSLIRVVQPFLYHEDTIASGGTVRVANGCKVKYGHIISKGVPRNLLAAFQLIEYLRAFLFGRVGWARLNALLIISGAFGVFDKESVVEVGGYRTNTIGEDMELIVRLHRVLSERGRPHRIEYVPDPVCWTEAPEDLKVFASQRKRWHRGLSESLYLNRDLLFSARGGPAGWLAFPFFILFEWLSPFVELAGYLFTAYLLLMGKLNLVDAGVILGFAVSLSVFLSTLGFVLDEITFPGETRLAGIYYLVLISILECFGYRQLNMYYKIRGAIDWITNRRHHWGTMTRTGAWQK